VFVEVDKLGGVLRRVIGAGHGLWAPNNEYTTLNGSQDPAELPLHVIVERGKHATAPDTDRDGQFTPGTGKMSGSASIGELRKSNASGTAALATRGASRREATSVRGLARTALKNAGSRAAVYPSRALTIPARLVLQPHHETV
jgi:hypothetical protein